MEYLQIFSQRVYELRKKRGLSQKELGEAVGLSHKAEEGDKAYRLAADAAVRSFR